MEHNTILCGDCLKLIPKLTDQSVSLVVTSPPYAEQRKDLYPGIPEHMYPQWTVRWMQALKPKLTGTASVMINIREHVHDGVISDYVHRTRLALREDGWHEIDELIWYARDKPPLGSNIRPRRKWERVLWFSLSRRPYVSLLSDTPTKRASSRTGGKRTKVNIFGKGRGGEGLLRPEYVRVSDLISVPTGTMDRRVGHPAMFPRGLARHLIKLGCKPGDLVLDPMTGSGTVPLVCRELKRRYIGMDKMAQFARLARRRLAQEDGQSEIAA